jgi:FixJ family two-component response regulator
MRTGPPIRTQSPEPTIFIIDDSQQCRESAGALAQSVGLRYEEFSSAEQFLASFMALRPGCVLVDFHLRGMNGFELQLLIAELDASLPVIIISAHIDVPFAVMAMEKGAYSVLEKPCGYDCLCDTLRSALEQNQQTRAAHQERAARRMGFDQLDEREREVAEMLLNGLPNKAMATRLDISPRTLNRVRTSLLRKMNADTVVELVRTLMKLRLDELGDENAARPSIVRSPHFRIGAGSRQ